MDVVCGAQDNENASTGGGGGVNLYKNTINGAARPSIWLYHGRRTCSPAPQLALDPVRLVCLRQRGTPGPSDERERERERAREPGGRAAATKTRQPSWLFSSRTTRHVFADYDKRACITLLLPCMNAPPSSLLSLPLPLPCHAMHIHRHDCRHVAMMTQHVYLLTMPTHTHRHRHT